jgi:ribosome-associated protein
MENGIQDKSKTQRKKEAEELQKLGEELTRLPRRQLERMALPDDLQKALLEAQSIKSNIAGRRQRQFIGVLMRNVDPESIRHALLQADEGDPVESEIEKETRTWLDTLLTGDPADMEDFLRACPGTERQRLRQLLRNIKKSEATGKSSKSINVLKQLIMKCMNNQ